LRACHAFPFEHGAEIRRHAREYDPLTALACGRSGAILSDDLAPLIRVPPRQKLERDLRIGVHPLHDRLQSR
jgi:hypothetical protein